jgi:tRNA pseudouridine55 synthase
MNLAAASGGPHVSARRFPIQSGVEMPRRKRGNAVHGWVVLDKACGVTSTRTVGAVRRIFGAQKAGHAGTLDPLATGVLPIALGEATKTVPFAVDGPKTYVFTVRWGVETTTDDAEGEPVRTSEMRPAASAIEGLFGRFTGEIMQVPPSFSAIKIEGVRAYDLARDGEKVALEARPVLVEALLLRGMPDRDTVTFEARCGKGAYVRALARDMGRALGCFGHVVALRRTKVGPFGEDDAVTLEALGVAAETGDADELAGYIKPVEAALSDLPGLPVSAADAASLACGKAVLLRGRDAPILSGPVYVTRKGRLVALAEVDRGTLRPIRVFNLTH